MQINMSEIPINLKRAAEKPKKEHSGFLVHILYFSLHLFLCAAYVFLEKRIIIKRKEYPAGKRSLAITNKTQ